MDSEMEQTPTASSKRAGGTDLVVSDWVRRRYPDLEPLVNADPDPVLLEHNLVALAADPATARNVALAFERTRSDHAEIGTVVLGDPTTPRRRAVDAEHVTAHAARRAVLGAVVGAVVFSVLIGLTTWAIFGGTAAVVGGAIGGALFGAGAGGTWSYVIGTGQSPAYREGFVDPATVQLVAVSVHAHDAACVEAAADAIAGTDGVELHRFDRTGREVG